MSADQQPTRRPPAPPAGSAQWAAAQWAPTSAAEPRGRRWPWIVALLVVVVLMAVAWIAGEQVARGLIERTIREQAITRLDLAADHEIDVDLPGSVLLPLLAGSISSVRVASDDIPLGDASGDIVVEAKDVPVFGDGDWSGAYATVTLDEPQLQRLLSSIDGFPAATVEIDAPDLAATFEIDALLARVPVGVALTPRAQGGDLVFTPTTFRVAGAEVSAVVSAEVAIHVVPSRGAGSTSLTALLKISGVFASGARSVRPMSSAVTGSMGSSSMTSSSGFGSTTAVRRGRFT